MFHGLVVNGAFAFEVIKVGNIFEFIIFIVLPSDDLVNLGVSSLEATIMMDCIWSSEE